MTYTSYRNKKVERYGIEDSTVYYKFDRLFYKLYKKGIVSLYTRVSSSSYSGPGGSFNSSSLSYAVKKEDEKELTILRVAGMLGKGKKYYKKTAMDYFSDNEELLERLKAGEFNKPEDIEILIDRYNEIAKE